MLYEKQMKFDSFSRWVLWLRIVLYSSPDYLIGCWKKISMGHPFACVIFVITRPLSSDIRRRSIAIDRLEDRSQKRIASKACKSTWSFAGLILCWTIRRKLLPTFLILLSSSSNAEYLHNSSFEEKKTIAPFFLCLLVSLCFASYHKGYTTAVGLSEIFVQQ